jgi:hypothetical protein
MTKDPKIKASEAVRAFLAEIGRKGGHAGKGSPAVIAKMRRANEIRLAKKKARKACEIEKTQHTHTPMKYLEDEQLPEKPLGRLNGYGERRKHSH